MDVWHWTSLVVLLAYAGLVAIPDAYYQAAKIDGASALGGVPLHPAAEDEARADHRHPAALHGQLHDLHRADRCSPAAARATRPRCCRSTSSRSRSASSTSGPAAAMSLIYFLIILLLSWIFYTVMTRDEEQLTMRAPRLARPDRSTSSSCCCRSTGCSTCRSRPPTRSSAASRCGRRTSRSTTTARSSPIRPGTTATSTRSSTCSLNTVISVTVALPAAYAFSRYRFLGDKHLFFWLLTNRMAPPAVFALPFFQLYSAVGLFDTHLAVALAHCLFNIPLAVWILEGFMSGVPKELDETAYRRRLLVLALLHPHLHADHRRRHRRRRVLLLHVLLGRAAARQDADLGRRQADRRDR